MHFKEKGLTRLLQDRVSEFNKNELIPALTKVCDQIVEPNQRVRIDKLEIDLGTIPIDKLEAEFKESIVNQFKNQLQRMVIKNPTLVETVQKTSDKAAKNTTEIESIHLKKIDLFVYFLKYGSIPWWYSTQELKMKDVIDELLINSQKPFLDKLIPLFTSYNIRLRVAETFSDKQFIRFVDPDNKLELKLIWNNLVIQFQQGFFKPQSLPKIKRTIFEKILSEITFAESISQRNQKVKRAFLESIIVLQPERTARFIKLGKIKAKKIEENTLFLKLTRNLNEKELKEILKEPSPQFIQKADNTTLIKTKQEDKLRTKQIIHEDTFVEINNAGIVLLWPYLQMFFKELNLIENKAFVDDASRWKAVHLLHFLAFGNEDAEEHQWALNKIVCGLQISDFVPFDFSLSKAEKAECNNLLQSVVKNWKVLKNTSVEGLQKSFLIRNGLIKNDQNGFIIEIERITIDILLDKLNWTLSVISLPWNKGLIHVKW